MDSTRRHTMTAHTCDPDCHTRQCTTCGEDMCMETPDRVTHETESHHAEEWSRCWECVDDAADEMRAEWGWGA